MITSGQSDNMIYFWISDYTLNTAGQVYHNAGKLKFSVNAWDKNVNGLFIIMISTNISSNFFTPNIEYYSHNFLTSFDMILKVCFFRTSEFEFV